jgi:hypothetical protein
MPLNVKMALYRGLLANLPSSTGQPGILAWTTDSNELFIDTGTAFQRLGQKHTVFNVANPAALTGLAANVGDIAVSASNGVTYILTAFPASNSANWTTIATVTPQNPAMTDVQWLGAPVVHEFVTYISSDGVQHLAQPSFADISGFLAETQLPATIAAGSSLTLIDAGTF